MSLGFINATSTTTLYVTRETAWVYETYGYRLVTEHQKEQLLRKYWKIPERQVETSVVLADRTWFERVMG